MDAVSSFVDLCTNPPLDWITISCSIISDSLLLAKLAFRFSEVKRNLLIALPRIVYYPCPLLQTRTVWRCQLQHLPYVHKEEEDQVFCLIIKQLINLLIIIIIIIINFNHIPLRNDGNFKKLNKFHLCRLITVTLYVTTCCV